ncbi:MAG: hypothetical protein WAM30_07565 [Candidatus Dormiibacterota bacterium]
MITSSFSQRQMVAPEMLATSPRLTTSDWMSVTWRRDKGKPNRLGSSQAIALTATTTSGGKNRGPPGPRALLEAGEAFFEEAFAPLGHDLESQVEAAADGLGLQPGSSHEHDLGSDNLSIR